MKLEHKEFLGYYLEHGDAEKAAKQAGYKGNPYKVGSRLKNHPEIKAAIEKAKLDQESKGDEISREALIEETRAILEVAKQGGSENACLKAIELLSKLAGIDRQKAESGFQVIINTRRKQPELMDGTPNEEERDDSEDQV